MTGVTGTAQGTFVLGTRGWRRAVLSCIAALMLLAASAPPVSAPAAAADPAVVFMAQVGRELMAAARTRSPGVMPAVVQRYGDVTYIGLFSLGAYRKQLPEAGEEHLPRRHGALRRPLCGHRGAQVSGRQGDVVGPERARRQRHHGGLHRHAGRRQRLRGALAALPLGSSYRVRDAMVLGFWMTPFLKKLFEDYIAQNGGNTRALITALNR